RSRRGPSLVRGRLRPCPSRVVDLAWGVMLLQFTFENHRSFREEAILSMAPASWTGEGVPTPLQLAAIYGANAAGKSNVVSALDTLKRIVSKGTQKSAEHLP